ncbi:MAG: hypothetical protein AAF399_21850 [Bacteroidota bacterium]
MKHPEVTHEQLIAWLYGELPESQREAVEAYLASHPKEKAELEQMKQIRVGLQALPEPEVQTPVLVLPGDPIAQIQPMNQWWKPVLAVAASVCLLLMGASLSQLEVGQSPEGWHVRFGSPEIQAPVQIPGTSAPEIQAMMEAALSEYQDSLRSDFADQQEQWQKQFAGLERKIPKNQGITESQFEQLSKQIKEENIDLVYRLTDWSQSQQQVQVEQLITELTQYLELQRNEDLQQIGYAFQEVQRKNEQSEELLTELVQYLR